MLLQICYTLLSVQCTLVVKLLSTFDSMRSTIDKELVPAYVYVYLNIYAIIADSIHSPVISLSRSHAYHA